MHGPEGRKLGCALARRRGARQGRRSARREPLSATLRDCSDAVRESAAKALRRIGWQPGKDQNGAWYWIAMCNWEECVGIGVAAVEPLCAALEFKNEYLRKEAAKALGKIGDMRAVDPLIAALKCTDRNHDLRSEAGEALGKIGAPAAKSLCAVLRGADTDVRYNAAKALVKIGVPSVELLCGALADADKDVRSKAADALGKIGDARAVSQLCAALKDADKTVREKAASALYKVNWKPGSDLNAAWYWMVKEN